MFARACLVLALLSLAVSSNTIADTWTVRLDGAGDFVAIQPALDAAAVGDTVLVADGVYTGDGNRDLTFGGKDLVVMSESDDPASCVIDCEGGPGDEHRGFVFDGFETRAAVLRGLTVRGGWVSGYGGGILCQWAGVDSLPAPLIERCVLTENTASAGGGIASIDECTIHLRECDVVANVGGGGLWSDADGSGDSHGRGTLESCSFDDNDGAGVLLRGLYSGPFLVNQCTISNNTGCGFENRTYFEDSILIASEIRDNGSWGISIAGTSSPAVSGERILREVASLVAGCEITGNGDGGIAAGGIFRRIEDCSISRNGGDGVRDFVSDGVLDMTGCLLEENEGNGIFSRSCNVELYHNTSRNNGGSGGVIHPDDCGPGIADNEFSGNGEGGLVVVWRWGYDELTIQRNILTGNGGSGLIVEGEDDLPRLALSSHTIAHNLAHGIECRFPAEIRLENNIIACNDQQAVSGDFALAADPTCNDLHANTMGDYVGIMAPYLGTLGNISADPMFCGCLESDYTIRADSPCADGNHPDGDDCGLIGALDVNCSGPLAVATPSATALLGNAPNPFNPSTTISFTLAVDGPVSLRVYDLTGRLVRTLVADEVMPRGRHDQIWRGRDDQGLQAASGLYLYRLQAGGVAETRRMALVK